MQLKGSHQNGGGGRKGEAWSSQAEVLSKHVGWPTDAVQEFTGLVARPSAVTVSACSEGDFRAACQVRDAMTRSAQCSMATFGPPTATRIECAGARTVLVYERVCALIPTLFPLSPSALGLMTPREEHPCQTSKPALPPLA